MTADRARDIRAALVFAGHTVSQGPITEPAPPRTEVWLHGLGVRLKEPCSPELLERLTAFPGAAAIYQLCDSDTMSFDKLPAELTGKARLFLRNHWPADKQHIPAAVLSRLGYLPPMMLPRQPHAGVPLSERTRGAMFYGTPTGNRDAPECREILVRVLRASGLPFEGGLSAHPNCSRQPPAELAVTRMPAREHARRLRDAKLCLAPWGFHKLTYRLYEGFAARCLVIAQPFSDVDFIHGGLEPGVHYVASAPDLSDLVPLVRYYLEHPVEAQRIADAGHAHFCRYFAPRGRLISPYLFERSVASWGELYRPCEPLSRVVTGLRAGAARVFPHWF